MTDLEKLAVAYIQAYMAKNNTRVLIAQARDAEMKKLLATTYSLKEMRSIEDAHRLMEYVEVIPLQSIEDSAFNELLTKVRKLGLIE